MFGLIEDDVGVFLGAVGGREDLVGREDEIPKGRFLLDDARVVLDVCRSGHAVDERGDVGRPADLVEIAGASELFFERHEIDGVAALGELHHLVERVVVQQNRAQD